MTYSPGSPGYPPANQPTAQFSAPTQHFGKLPEQPTAGEGPNKLPVYLLMVVAALGLLVYLCNFGPIFQVNASDFLGQSGTVSGSTLGIGLAVVAALSAGLLAGVTLLSKGRTYVAIAAVLSVLALLLVIAELVNKPSEASIGWALYALIVLSLLQAGSAVAALLFDTGVLTPPAPKPKYDQQQQYGQYGGPGGYYGQPHTGGHQPQQHHGGSHQQGPAQQRPGYPSQYGGYPGGSGPTTGGFPASGQQSGPPTPPTGFPTYGQPQQQGGGTGTSQGGQGQGGQGQQPQSSQQSGPDPS